MGQNVWEDDAIEKSIPYMMKVKESVLPTEVLFIHIGRTNGLRCGYCCRTGVKSIQEAK